jgi:anti-anti-sigma factor
VLTCKGPLTMLTVGPLRDAVKAETAPVLILVFKDVPQMDSAGLGLLLQFHATFTRTSRRLAIAGVCERVRAVMDVTGISSVLALYSTRADAEQALS